MLKKLFMSLFILVLASMTEAKAQDLEFYLINETSVPVVGFYVSHTGTDSWEENLMAGGYLDSGYEISVLIADGLTTCMYDIRTEFDDGYVFEDYGLDLCDMGEYIFQ